MLVAEAHTSTPEVDDGECVEATERIYSSLLVNTIRALDSAEQSLFSEDHIPNLERMLMFMTSWGELQEDMYDVCYAQVLKGYGRRLFGARTVEERKQRRVAQTEVYKTFVRSLSVVDRKKRGDKPPGAIKNFVEDDEDGLAVDDGGVASVDGPWFRGARSAERSFSSFSISLRWKEYRE